jgi:hypothetical protein
MSLCVIGIVVPDVLNDHSSFIFRVKKCKGKCGHVCRYVPTSTCMPVLLLGQLDRKDEGTVILQNVLSYNPNDIE